MEDAIAATLRDPRFADLWDPVLDMEQVERCWHNNCARGEDRSIADCIQWFDDRKAVNHILARRVGLNTLEEWRMDGDGFLAHREDRFFRIIGLNITCGDREVANWSQPIIANRESGIIGLLVKEEEGERSFLMQAKAEVGNRSIVQIGPTVQFTAGNYSGNYKLAKPFLFDEFTGGSGFPVLWENWQAEEGARFYREQHLHRILRLPEGEVLSLPPDYRWLTQSDLKFFLGMGDFVNSCARSIISCLL